MINKLSITCFILVIAPLFFSCSEPVKEQTKNNAPANSISLHVGNENYAVIDTKQSVVLWKGSNSFGTHTGYVDLSKGELMIENGQLMGGILEVDMKTIVDENKESDNNLIKHLKDSDFFDVTKFPFATIAITKVASINTEEKEVTGNLTIRGITHPVTFPAKMEIKNGIVTASGKLVIDRTKWDVRYKSGKFFDNLKDQAIADDIELDVKIVAKNN